MRLVHSIALSILATTLLAADSVQDSGYQVAVVKSAAAEHEKVLAKAADDYRKAVIAADRAYMAKLSQLESSPAVQKVSGEPERVREGVKRVDAEIKQYEDQTMAVVLRPAESPVDKLKKGMTRDELVKLFPAKPDEDDKNADGDETIEWDKRARDSSGGGVMSLGQYSGQMLSGGSTHVTDRLIVTLKDGVVTDWRTVSR